MKILVTAKRVVDYNVKVRAKADESAVETANVKMSMNPFDEIAVEEAVRLKENNIATEIVVVSLGEEKCQEVIRNAIAMGADRGIHVKGDQEFQPLAVAKILQKIIEEEKPDIVIMGKQAIDDDFNQTGQMLSALLDWPQATFASNITINGDNAEVAREVDTGTEIIKVKLPAVITTDLRLNEPRYAKLPNIMKARSKPLDTKTPEDYGVDITPRLQTIKVEAPEQRSGGIKVENVQELVNKLKEAGAI